MFKFLDMKLLTTDPWFPSTLITITDGRPGYLLQIEHPSEQPQDH